MAVVHSSHTGASAGEWFCPRCRSELALESGDQPRHSSLMPTPFMLQEDCFRRLAAALGDCRAMSLHVHARSQQCVQLACFVFLTFCKWLS